MEVYHTHFVKAPKFHYLHHNIPRFSPVLNYFNLFQVIFIYDMGTKYSYVYA